MTDSKHTPGPWEVNFESVLGADGKDVCQLQDGTYGSKDEARTQKEVRANGLLIAAAPELLAALEAASLNVCAAHGFPSRVHQQILRAIYNAKNNQK